MYSFYMKTDAIQLTINNSKSFLLNQIKRTESEGIKLSQKEKAT